MENPSSFFRANVFIHKFAMWTMFLLYLIFKTLIAMIPCHYLNLNFPPITFRFEIENKEQIPRLDLLVISNCTNSLEFNVFRKILILMIYS